MTDIINEIKVNVHEITKKWLKSYDELNKRIGELKERVKSLEQAKQKAPSDSYVNDLEQQRDRLLAESNKLAAECDELKSKDRDYFKSQLVEMTAERDELERRLADMTHACNTYRELWIVRGGQESTQGTDPLEFTEKPRSLGEFVRDLERRVKRLEGS